MSPSVPQSCILRTARSALGAMLAAILIGAAAHAAPRETQALPGVPGGKEWTDTQLPSCTRRVTYFGERPDWSHDGKRILFVGRTFGDVYELDLASSAILPVTHHYYHGGYTRALYLANGDILLSGPRRFDPDDWQDARFRQCELWVLGAARDQPPTRLGEYCWEGPCVSRRQLRIAWAVQRGVYPERPGLSQLWVAELDYSAGPPRLAHPRMVLDNTREEVRGAILEPQNFRPPNETELIFQATVGGTDVLGIDLASGAIVNYAQSPDTYDEPEGIFPDGSATLVESSRHVSTGPDGGRIDLWRLSLDGRRQWQRLTWFNETGRYKATNPVVSDDGRYMAFTVPRAGDVAGVAHGIYVYDLRRAPRPGK